MRGSGGYRCRPRPVPSLRTTLAATLRLADLDARENRLQDAVARLETAARQTPRSAAVWSALARVYRRSGRTRRALAAWRRVAALDAAAAPDACRERAALYESLADFDHAEQAYEEALRRSRDAVSHRLYGSLLLRRRHLGDRLPRAIAQLERAVALAPDDPAGFIALSSAYEAAGRDAEALVALRHAIDLAPGAGTPYLAAGRLARRLGQPEEGRELLAMYRRYRQAEQELESLKAVVAGRPEDAAARLALADYYFTARDFSRAADEYERALIQSDLPLSPGARRAAHQHLAFAYEQLARREEATAQLALAERQ